ncbi:DUF6114 domain-containing protein [Nocardiopsis alborubida]|uniref:Uncharacterized protein n=1 Tax=Nocardiopsis alborubida TaxID=146802 RepID=A0A7X6MLT4_9ACTN|nr:DUF6114 domain-containing protein [Nocardiopsis alborubida]NKZ01836.1 hypothetical protein [Nocardiopsis alborubida]
MAHALTLLRGGRARFRNWRRGRPFWGGLLLVVAGVELLVAPAAQSLILPIDLIAYTGIAGVSGPLIAVLLVTLGVLSWFQPAQHLFFGVVGLMLALVSFVTSNFGGFVIGMLLGIVGGSLVFAWAPHVDRRRRRGRGRRRAADADVTGPEAADSRGAGTPDEAVSAPRPPSRPLAALALPLALAVTLASAAASADWPWDWFLPPGDEEEQPADEPSPSPSPSGEPSASPTDRPTPPGTGPGADEGDGDDEQSEDEETGEEPEESGEDRADPDECQMSTGESALAGSEEEFLDAVRACQAAQEEGELPEVPVEEAHDCSSGSVRTSGLTADRLTMSGARYDGVVECPTLDGPRRYIRLTMSRADFVDAELWFEDAGTRMSLGLPTMTMDGSVQMHITRMHVRILGIPLTFTPDFPPPLLLPYMIVTDVDVDNPLASTDVMNIPNLNGRYGGA